MSSNYFFESVSALPLTSFAVARLPAIHFGSGRIAQLPDLISALGSRVLLITGGRSFVQSPHWPVLLETLQARHMPWWHETITGEPSPDRVDDIVARYQGEQIEVVVGIGGGSPLDAAKAIAGLLPTGNSVMDHLEGVGKGLPYKGPALPLIAVPTTAGTGSEATKNAVLSHQGPQGFKKSFRDDQLVPRMALIDPDLLASCPKAQIAANGMDAFTQLLESWVSINASPFTDALAWSGMTAFKQGLWDAVDATDQRTSGYSRLAYASLMSGITLAQAGLGSVHGLASPLGAFFPIPHGEVCGTLLAEATAINIEAMCARQPDSVALERYAAVGRMLADQSDLKESEAHAALLKTLHDWTEKLNMPRLREYGIEREDFPQIVANARGGSMKTNPIVVSDEELVRILERRL